jgi:predicted MPP superfamily phosphohydrolase
MFFVFLIVLNAYIFIRGWQALPRIPALRNIYAIVVLFILGCVFLSYFFNERLPEKLDYPFRLLRKYYIIFFVLFFLSAALADSLRFLNHLFGIFPDWVVANYSRVKIIYFLVTLIITSVISISGFRRFSNPEIVDLSLKLSYHKKEINRMNIIAASDLHLGKLVRRERLAAWTEMINEEKPDLILLVGDIFDHTFLPKESDGIITELTKLKAKYGVYAVPGNHEYYFNINKSLDYLERSGIKVLRDTTVVIDNRLTLAGRDDAHNRKRKTVELLLTDADTSLPVILMDHQPVDLHSSVKNKIDLHISGHTHNGQIFPGNYIAKLKWELVYGYRKVENSNFYVTSGLGLSFIPIRIGTRSEIVRINLTGKDPSTAESLGHEVVSYE